MARLKARKAVVDGEVAERRRHLEGLRAAAAEGALLERQLGQAAGWVRELLELQRGVLRLQQSSCDSFVEVKSQEQVRTGGVEGRRGGVGWDG